MKLRLEVRQPLSLIPREHFQPRPNDVARPFLPHLPDDRPRLIELAGLAQPGELLELDRRLGERIGGLGSMLTQLGEQAVELDEKRATLEGQLVQQKRVESALRVSEERWRALAENVPGVILILSEGGRLISACGGRTSRSAARTSQAGWKRSARE